MSSRSSKEIRVLAIDPASRGFGFAVLERPSTLVDWGVKGVRRNKHSGCLAKVAELIDYYQPDVIALEDCSRKDCRRSQRIQRLIDGIIRLAVGRKIKARKVSRTQVRGAFSESNDATKHQLASVIARRFPELASRLPPRRRAWMSEDSRMQMFNAIALGLSFFSGTARSRCIRRGAIMHDSRQRDQEIANLIW
jgi:Holliday junction resolvasome RuvABC endonuclease subunit